MISDLETALRRLGEAKDEMIERTDNNRPISQTSYQQLVSVLGQLGTQLDEAISLAREVPVAK